MSWLIIEETSQAMMRIILGILSSIYLAIGIYRGDFILSVSAYLFFVVFFFLISGLLRWHIQHYQHSIYRCYFSLCFDISMNTLAMYFTGAADSVFLFLYIWIYMGYGMRYGVFYLSLATVLTLFTFTLLLVISHAMEHHLLDSMAKMLFLLLLPIYLYSLLKIFEETKQQAHAANRAKSHFLAIMSHEIRTPVNGILGMTRLLSHTPLNQQQKEYLQGLNASSQSLYALINNILDFSKIEAGQMQLKKEMVNLLGLLEDILCIVEAMLDEKQLELILWIDNDVPEYLYTDKHRLQQVLLNLVMNALKFTEQGEIELKVSIKAQSILFYVRDTGVGIADDQLKKVFDSFTQLDTSLTNAYRGSGLGTSISQQLMTLMGGTIKVKSKEGVGTQFTITLPIDRLPENVLVTDTKPISLWGRNILLIESHPLLCQVLQQYFQDQGMRVTASNNIENSDLILALQQRNTEQCTFDVIVFGASYKRNYLGLASLIKEQIDPLPLLIYLVPPCLSHEVLHYDFLQCLTKPVSYRQLQHVLQQYFYPESIQDKSSLQQEKEQSAVISYHILLAEDEEINATVISQFLRKAGHTVTRVKDGKALLELQKNAHCFDLLLVDMRMPVMDGVTAVQQWRNQEKTLVLPIVALTANATKKDKQQCLDAGMDDFILKPVTPEQLEQIVQKYCHRVK